MDRILPRKALAVFLALAFAVMTAQPAMSADRKVQHRVPPDYPELARRMHIEGRVGVEASVAPNGSVTSVKAISGNALLQAAAEQAIRKWKFASETNPSTEKVEVDFRLSD